MRLTILLSILLTLATLAPAAPRTRPTPIEDGSGPRAALLMYDKLVGPNESDKALPLYYATTTRERALAALLAKCDGALANLHKKAADKFSPDIADAMIRSVDATTAEDINAAKIQVTGDTAAVTFPNASHPTPMIRVKGEWKINVKALFQELQSSPKSMRQSLGRFAAAANQVAAKIEEGQYTSPEAAGSHFLEAYRKAFAPSQH
jgi:hypothetical protein